MPKVILVYRLVSFHVGQEQYLILTNRLDLTTFQVILLYAYRLRNFLTHPFDYQAIIALGRL